MNGKKIQTKTRKMSGTTYMTDFMEQVLKEEYESYTHDTIVDEFFEHFCFDSPWDRQPNWSLEKIKGWVKERLSMFNGFDILPQMMQHGIYRDIDLDYLAEWLTKEHEFWWLDQQPEQAEVPLNMID